MNLISSYGLAICSSSQNGNWSTISTWGCGSVPQCGDTIYILEDHTVTVNVQTDYTGCPVPMYIIVEGHLTFNNGKKLLLPTGSGVLIKNNGLISGGGGGSSNLIEIGNTNWWSSSEGPIDTSSYLGEIPFVEEIISITNGNWNDTSTWLCNCVPDFYSGITIDTNHTVTLTADADVFNVDNYGTLDAGSNSITVSGDWNNYSQFNSGTSSVIFEGSQTQNIIGNNTFHNITINNTSGVAITSGSDSLTGTLTLTSGNFSTNNSLTLISDANGTARIAEITGGNISGDVTVQRYIDAGATNWRFLSSPISGATLADLDDDFITSGFPGSNFPEFIPSGWTEIFTSVYYYDETFAGPVDSGYVRASDISNAMDVGEGLWVWSGDTITGTDPFIVDVTGTINSGTINLPVSYTNSGVADDDGWNMVGNPYPCSIDWDDPSITKTNINNAIYIWNPDIEQFASYAGGVGVNGGSNEIAAFQGFWVQANAASPVLKVEEASKNAAVDASFIKERTPVIPLTINIQGYYGVDQTAINIQENATEAYDPAYDAFKMPSSNYYLPQITTVIDNSVDLSINQISNHQTTIPVKILSYFTDSISIHFEHVNRFTNNRCIFFEDLYNDTIYNIENTSSIKVLIADTTQHPRFILHIGGENVVQETNVSCYAAKDGVVVFEKKTSDPYSIVWKDNTGSTLKPLNTITGADSIANLEPGTYLIETNGMLCGTRTDSITINEPPLITPIFSTNKDSLLLNQDELTIANLSNNANYYLWEMGDGNVDTAHTPHHQYLSPGEYTIHLTAYQDPECYKSTSTDIVIIDNTTSITTSINQKKDQVKLWIAQNTLHSEVSFNGDIIVQNIAGQHIVKGKLLKGDTWTFSLNGISSQILFVGVVNTDDNSSKLIKIHYTKK